MTTAIPSSHSSEPQSGEDAALEDVTPREDAISNAGARETHDAQSSPELAARAELDECSRQAAAGDVQALARLDQRLRPGLERHFQRKLSQFSFANAGGSSGSGGGGAGGSGTGDAARRAAGAKGGAKAGAGGTLGGVITDAADELAQQTWIVFWKALSEGRYDPSRARLSTYLYAIAANIWLRYMRTATRNLREQSLDWIEDAAADRASGRDNHESARVGGTDSRSGLAGAAGSDSAALALSEAEQLDAVRRVVAGDEPAAGLTPDERDVLRAIADGRSDRELATSLGIAPSTAHVRKRSAMDKLRAFLASKGFSGPSNDPGER